MKRVMVAVFVLLSLVVFSGGVFAEEESDFQAQAASEIWDGSIAESFAGGTGTESDPYLISNGAELAKLAQDVNGGEKYTDKYFTMTKNIYLNDTEDWESWNVSQAPANRWIPIGNDTNPFSGNIVFSGNFDGLNHTVNGIYAYDEDRKNQGGYDCQGLFGGIQKRGGQQVIQNLSISQSYINSYAYAGALAGCAASRYNTTVTIRNCHNYSNVEGKRDGGGICGYASSYHFMNDNARIAIENCSNSGNINSPANAGGIVGFGSNSGGFLPSPLKISESINKGSVASESKAGGIAGSLTLGYSSTLCCDLINIGTVYGKEMSGGIVASATGGYSEAGSFQRCVSLGQLTTDEGGLKGALGCELRSASADHIYVKNCFCKTNENGEYSYWVKELNDSQIADSKNFTGFDFNSVWAMSSELGRPVLRNNIEREYADENYRIKNNGQYAFIVQDSKTGNPIEGVGVASQDRLYTTGTDGRVKIQLENADTTTIVYFNKANYTAKSDYLSSYNPHETNTITMDSTENDPNLNLDLGTTTVKGPTVSLGDWGEFPIFSMDMGMNLGDVSAKQKVDAEKKTITYQFGLKDSSDESSYQNIKTLYEMAGNKKTDAAFYNKYRQIQSNLKSQNVKMGVDLDGSVIGYMKYSYATGKMELEESGVLIVAKASVDFKQGIPQTANLCYVKLKITGEFNGKIQMKVVDSNIKNPQMLADLSVALGLKVGVGAGLEGIAYAEGGVEGKATLGVSLYEHTAENPLTLENTLSAKISAGLYIKSSLLGFWETDQSMTLAEWQLYPQVSGISLMSLDDYNAYHLPSRDYLYGISTMALDEGDDAYIEKNTYPYGAPQIVTLADGRLMALWIGDDGQKGSTNRTTLMYTFRDNDGNWSEARAVYESGKADLAPAIAVDGNTVHVVWHNGTEVFPDNITMTEMFTKMNLVYSSFDGNTFSAPVTVNTEGSGKMQQLPAIDAANGKVTVSWVENNDNDPYMSTGTNSLFTRTYNNSQWEAISTLSGDIGYLNSIALQGDKVFFSKDGDGDPTTEGDSDVWWILADGTMNSLSSGQNIKNIDGALYWVDNNRILTSDDGESVNAYDVTVSSNYDVLTINGSKTILYTQKDGFKSELYTVTQNEDGTWSNPVAYTSYDAFIRSYDATVDASGNIITAMDRVAVNDNYDGTGSPYGFTDFAITSIADRYDLSVDPTLYYDTTALAPGATIDVTAEVTNTSTKDVDSLKLTWLDADDQVTGTSNLTQSIGVGETAEVTTTYTLPNPLSHQTVKLKIEAEGVTEDSLDNNTATMEYGFSDVALESGNLTKNADGTGTITVDVKNTGVDTAEGVTVDLYKDGTSGEMLSQQVVGSVSSGQRKSLTYVLSKEQMTCADEYDGKLFYLDAQSTSVESDYANNTNELLLDPVVATNIGLNQEAVTLTAGDTAQLTASLTPSDAVSTTHWVSDDTTVATVDDTGKITAVAAGMATITAIASEATRQCVVTVEAGPVGKLYGRSLSLNGDIAVNFYMALDETTDPTTISMKFWKDGKEEQAHTVAYDSNFYIEQDGKRYYGFAYNIAAKEMGDTIKAQLMVKDGDNDVASGDIMAYSAQTYAQNKLNSESSNETLKALVRTMLNYGTGAQNQFAYKTTEPANDILSDTEKNVPVAALGDEYSGYTTTGTVTNPTAVFYGNSLILESQTYLKYYITLTEGVDADTAKLKYRKIGDSAWKTLDITKDTDSSYYVAVIDDIAAKELKDMYEAYVAVGDVPISETRVYGSMSYAKNKLTQGTDTTLCHLMNAMVDYCDKAKVQFNY